MEISQDQVLALIGAKEVELYSLRMQIRALQSALEEARRVAPVEEPAPEAGA